MTHLLESRLTVAQRQECEANDAALARAMAQGRVLRFNNGPAYGIYCNSMDALMASLDTAEALGVEVGRIEVSEAEWAEFEVQRNVDKGERLARLNDQHAADLQLQYQGWIGELPR